MMDEDDEIEFQWDDAKAASNLDKHGVRFGDATYVFDDPTRLEDPDDLARGEYRSVCIGKVDGVILTVVFSEPNEGSIRIISARRATAAERKRYDANLI
jgi:uncharacterized DUF497 family protein